MFTLCVSEKYVFHEIDFIIAYKLLTLFITGAAACSITHYCYPDVYILNKESQMC